MKCRLLLALVALAGCTTMGHQISDAQIASFKPGVTREADVIAAIGDPTSSMTEPDGSKIDRYSYMNAHPTFIPGQVDSTTSNHAFHFDKNGVLLDTTSDTSKNNVSAYGL